MVEAPGGGVGTMAVQIAKLYGAGVGFGIHQYYPKPGLIQATINELVDYVVAGRLILHLVNLTNPMMMKGPLRELIPVGAQEVCVRLPDGLRPAKAHLLTAGKALRLERRNRELRFTILSILDHEILAIDLA